MNPAFGEMGSPEVAAQRLCEYADEILERSDEFVCMAVVIGFDNIDCAHKAYFTWRDPNMKARAAFFLHSVVSGLQHVLADYLYSCLDEDDD